MIELSFVTTTTTTPSTSTTTPPTTPIPTTTIVPLSSYAPPPPNKYLLVTSDFAYAEASKILKNLDVDHTVVIDTPSTVHSLYIDYDDLTERVERFIDSWNNVIEKLEDDPTQIETVLAEVDLNSRSLLLKDLETFLGKVKIENSKEERHYRYVKVIKYVIVSLAIIGYLFVIFFAAASVVNKKLRNLLAVFTIPVFAQLALLMNAIGNSFLKCKSTNHKMTTALLVCSQLIVLDIRQMHVLEELLGNLQGIIAGGHAGSVEARKSVSSWKNWLSGFKEGLADKKKEVTKSLVR